MSISIAGRKVEKGDNLYHVGYRLWGVVTHFDVGTAVLKLTGTDGSTRQVHVQDNGIVGKARQVYWHVPVRLDLPVSDISSMQKVVDVMAQEYGK